MSGHHVIAIDGPAASGKSTVARAVAAQLGFLYVDSGALYRAVTWLCLQREVSAGDTAGIVDAMRAADVRFFEQGGAVAFSLNGEVLDFELRGDDVSHRVSEVAAVPEVRAQIVTWLRGMSELGSLAMEGRDIGTVVFPDAPHKFYLDASPEERARRRKAEFDAHREEAQDVDHVLNALQQRDAKDSSRATAPLAVADGACVLDSTGMSVIEVAEEIIARTGLATA